MESPEYYTKQTLVLGCGNILFGDDGFGPDVADYLLSNYKIPEDAAVLNLGLSTRGFIFDILLSEQRPKRIIIVDAVSYNDRKAGEIFEVPLDNLVKEKVDDFSFHQGPTSNLLRELRDKVNELRARSYELQALSMGMTDDFEVAIEEGANMLRLGRAIFEA